MKQLRDVDVVILGTILALLAIGVTMVYSSAAIQAATSLGDEAFFVRKHGFFALLGLFLMTVTALVPYHYWRRLTYPILIGVVLLLVAVIATPLGVTHLGATRWINLGVIKLQPSELAKPAMVIYLAYSLEKKQSHINTFSVGILPHLVFGGIVLGLILAEKDFGTTMTLAAIIALMLYLAGVRLWHLAGLATLVAPVAYLVMMGAAYRRRRITAFLDPWANQQDQAYQLIQGWIGFRAGGWTGKGLGESTQKLAFLPEAHTDFILAIFAEEWGLVGVVVLIALYGVFLHRSLVVCMQAPDLFGRLLGMGIATLVAMQASINIGVVTGVLPTKGLTLPLISYGGSSVVITLAMLGILLNVTTHARRDALREGTRGTPFHRGRGRRRERAGALPI